MSCHVDTDLANTDLAIHKSTGDFKGRITENINWMTLNGEPSMYMPLPILTIFRLAITVTAEFKVYSI